MILCIGQILDQSEVADVLQLLARAEWRPGRETAGWAAQGVKDNRQLAGDSPAHGKISATVLAALARNETFTAAALPRQISPLLVTRTEEGMGYGPHVDNAVMHAPPLRTDLAFTLFLASVGDYEGGELVIEDTQGEQAFKLAPGALVLYPATTLHRVEKVRSGVRLVVAGWAQSLVRDPRVREMLFDLEHLRRSAFARDGKSAELDLLCKLHSNLLRLHAEI